MEANGFPLDVTECNKQIDELQERIDWVDEAILPLIPPSPKQDKTTITKVFKINGDYTKQIYDWLGEEPEPNLTVGGAFNRIEFVPINLSSHVQVNKWLLANGWKPKTWNYKKDKSGKEVKDFYGNKIKTSPKLTEEDYPELKELGPAAALIAYRRQLTHKRNQIQGFLRDQRDDGTVPSLVNTLGAATRRMTHSKIVNVPAPKEGALWKTMRKVFHAPEGYVVVGADADQCQVRGLDHYMNDEEFRDALLNGSKSEGTDLHSLNSRRAGVSRSHAKNVFYGYLFGAGANKTASQIGCSVSDAERIRKKFESGLPALVQLLKDLTSFYRKHGYIIGIDGTKIYVTSEHMLLVYLLQNFEAVLVKWALVIAYDTIQERGLDAKLVTIQHDEFQWIVKEEHAKEVGTILEKSFYQAGIMIGSKCIIKGEAEIGHSWYETH